LPPIEETLTSLNGQPKNAKGAVIQKLSKQWPMTPKQLAHCLQREFGLDITYQAVYKALRQLEEEKVVEKILKGYQLHQEWIEALKRRSHNISHAYSTTEILDPEKEITQLTFHNWLAVGRFTAFRFDLEYPNPDKKQNICNWIHVWPVMGLSSEEAAILQKQYSQEEYYSVCPNNTPIDKAFAEWLVKVGKKCKTDVSILIDHDYIIKGDYICNIYYPFDFLTDVDKFYRETERFDKLDYKKLTELINRKVNIQIVIVKNKQLADQLRQLTRHYFK
jgi:DNA-binding PadR family transcriptional regulator